MLGYCPDIHSSVSCVRPSCNCVWCIYRCWLVVRLVSLAHYVLLVVTAVANAAFSYFTLRYWCNSNIMFIHPISDESVLSLMLMLKGNSVEDTVESHCDNANYV